MHAPKVTMPEAPAAPTLPPPPPQLSSTLQAASNQRAAAAAAAGKGFGDTVLTMPEPIIQLDKQPANNVTTAANKLLGAGAGAGSGTGPGR